MTNEEKALVIQMLEARVKVGTIARMLPYDEKDAKKQINKLRKSGEITYKVATKKEIVNNLYKSGVRDFKEFKETAKCSESLLRSTLGDKVKKERPKKYKLRKPTDIDTLSDLTKTIIEELKQGKLPRQIAHEHNFSTQYIYEIKNKYVKRR